MAKLIKILVASVGGGIVLGAGIRLGEAIASQLPAPGSEAADRLADRLGDLEHRLQHLESGSPAVAVEQREETMESTSVPAEQVREELRGWLEETVSLRITEVEGRLHAETERNQKQMLDAFAESVETRVIQRISRLENEVASQSAAMAELRECSLRTEHSVHKLLGGLDKLIPKSASPADRAAQVPEPEPSKPSTPEPEETRTREVVPVGSNAELPEPPLLTPPSRPRRWRLFR